MNRQSWLERGAIRFGPLISLLLLAGLLMPVPAQAEGGLGLSGSFYRQAFEIPQGSSVSAPSIYVVVFNNSDEEFGVRMTTEAPVGVNIILSEDDFTLQPGEQNKVFIEVEVTNDAAPGEYEIGVTAESYKEGVGGIQLVGSAGQSATLVVLGESASVTVRVVSPDGEPVAAVVRLFKVMAGENHEFAYGETGTLEATVSPGSFIAQAYLGGNRLAEESFDVAADEEKTVNLTVATVYFEGFGIVPNYATESGELAFAEVVYTINNLYQIFPQAEVMLRVSHGGTPEEVRLAAFTPLGVGRMSGLSYNYIPAEGWKQGSYSFRLELYCGGELYAATQQQELVAGGTSAATNGSSSAGGGSFNWMIVAGGAAGLALFIVAAVLLRRRG